MMSVLIITYEHVTGYKASIWLQGTVGDMTKIIFFSRKPKFKSKLNLKVTKYRRCKQQSNKRLNEMENIFQTIIKVFSTHIGTKARYNPTFRQFDH
jgi:hypothetical protein